MPHMSNLPWILFYVVINLTAMLFICKESFQPSLLNSSLTTSNKITGKNNPWKW